MVNSEEEDPKAIRAILLVTSGKVLNLTQSPELAALKAGGDLSHPLSYNLSRTSLRPVVSNLYYTAAEKWHPVKASDLPVIYLNFVSTY